MDMDEEELFDLLNTNSFAETIFTSENADLCNDDIDYHLIWCMTELCKALDKNIISFKDNESRSWLIGLLAVIVKAHFNDVFTLKETEEH